jgi:putative heme-binding domain-containing protein
VGGDAGPDLSRIGQIRSRQDLIEAIVAPSVSFVRSYEPVVAVLHAGKLVSGVLKFENESEVAIQTGPSVVERIPRREVESVAPGAVSLMPAGLEKQVSPQELADLVAFLLERK